MKIACCQFDPVLFNVEYNMKQASDLLKDFKQGDIEVLVLPEMAFTGYAFESLEEITPYLEDQETGPSVTWAKEQAKRLRCFVIVGYPQKAETCNYNSICFVNPEGKLVKTYQKAYLYETDETWAEEGPGFASFHVEGLGKVGLGICMDLNPYRFKTSFYEYEFAKYHLQHNTELLLCSMSWLKGKGDTSSFDTIKYWMQRLSPLFTTQQANKAIVFAACNRIGQERSSTFAGGSCIAIISNQEINLLGYLESNVTDILLIQE